MKPHQFKKFDLGTAWEMPWKCFELMKVNYPLALGVGFITFLCTLLSGIPFIGPMVSDPLLLLVSVGTLFLAQKWEKNEKADFQFFLDQALNQDRLKKILPLFVILSLLALVNQGLALGLSALPMGSILAFVFSTLFNFAKSIIILGAALMVLKNESNIQRALTSSLNATLSNFISLFFLGLIYVILSLICIVLFVLPVIFIFFPLTVSSSFILYRVVFDGLEFNTNEKEDLFI